jgi:hypothetical protein
MTTGATQPRAFGHDSIAPTCDRRLPAGRIAPEINDLGSAGASVHKAGATWTQIGEALGITKQAAHDFYRRKIEEQEKYLPDLHDVAAARAVLEEVKED